jgi:hypothetical protein
VKADVRAASGTLYHSKDQLERWFAKAAPGAKKVYATGPGIDHREAVVAMVRDWQESGEAELFQMRDESTRQLMYCVRRLKPTLIEALGEHGNGRRARIAVDEAFRETPEGRVYMMLVRSANLGRGCPTNAALAEFAGLKNADQARYVLHEKLVKPGLIEIRHEGAGNAQRRVKIVETGRWTAAIAGGSIQEMAR